MDEGRRREDTRRHARPSRNQDAPSTYRDRRDPQNMGRDSRRDGYRESYRDRGRGGNRDRSQDIKSSATKRMRQEYVLGPKPEKPVNSWWDEPTPGYERLGADVVKFLVASTPRTKLPAEIPPRLARIRDVPPLVPDSSCFLRYVLVQPGLGFTEYAQRLFNHLGLSDNVEQLHEGWLLPSPEHVALLIAFPGPFTIRRPPGLILPQNPSSEYIDPSTHVILANEGGINFEGRHVVFGPPGQAANSTPLYERPLCENVVYESNALQILGAVPLNADSKEVAELLETIRSLVPEGSVHFCSHPLFRVPRLFVFLPESGSALEAMEAVETKLELNGPHVVARIDENFARFFQESDPVQKR